MATLSGGPNSGFSGKVGSVVGYYRLGKWVIRGLPRLSPKNKKGSVLQNVHRSRFAIIQRFLKPITYFVRTGFNLEARKKGNTAYNCANSYNLLNAFNERGELDYSKTRVSSGVLAGAENAAVSFQDGHLVFTWSDNSMPLVTTRAILPMKDDQSMLLAYEPEQGDRFYMLSGARRSACRESLKIPALKSGTELHIWIAFIAADRESMSNSAYLGIVRI